MEKLDIEWLHKENKEGRRSGRTVEMLANVVGSSLVLDEDSEIYVVCAPGSEEATANELFDVFQAIAPISAYYGGCHKGCHCLAVIDRCREVLITVQSKRLHESYTHGKKKPILEFIDHAFFEYHKNMEHRRRSVLPRPGNINRNPLFFPNLPPYCG